VQKVRGLKILAQTIFQAIPLFLDTILVMLFYFFIAGIAGQQVFSGELKRQCFNI
jgi:hypothetical protein